MSSPQPSTHSSSMHNSGHGRHHHHGPPPATTSSSSGAGRTGSLSAGGLIFSPNSSAAALALSALAGTTAAPAPSAVADAPVGGGAGRGRGKSSTTKTAGVVHGFVGSGPTALSSMTSDILPSGSNSSPPHPRDNEEVRHSGNGSHLPPATRLFSNTKSSTFENSSFATTNNTNSNNNTAAVALDALTSAYQHHQEQTNNNGGGGGWRVGGLVVDTGIQNGGAGRGGGEDQYQHYQNHHHLDEDGYPVLPSTITSSSYSSSTTSYSSSAYPLSQNSFSSSSSNPNGGGGGDNQRRQSFGVTWAPTPTPSGPSTSSSGRGAPTSLTMMGGGGPYQTADQYTPMSSMYRGNHVSQQQGMMSHVTPSPPAGSMGLPTPKKFKMELEDGTAVAIGSDPSFSGANGALSYENHNLLATAYSRKKKSLGVLADNFLETYKSLTPGTHIIIDEAAKVLGVERRRIYDIVNILESIGIVCKFKKNTYSWMGLDRLPKVFGTLQEMAIPEHAEDAQKFIGCEPPVPSPSSSHEDVAEALIPDAAASTAAAGQQTQTTKNAATKATKATRSLAKLAQEFLQVYLVGNETLSLPEASDKILGSATQEELITLGGGPTNRTVANTIDLEEQRKLRQAAARGLKTKIRRLYDIANVFLSVGLLTKVESKNGLDTRRPHFQWSYHFSAVDIYRLHNNRVKEGGDSKEVGNGIKL
eukprot:CAMPEP_0113514598 /NCGR_PEP_ID=MMETSP0014_2-20120614/40494_1 /TAXON_ID=2857 /ORGANISM="Nitzschia sp." /LENGTH=699 /DNA_ID=CAMNT_0000411105 /DNA_START=255 /DNA_END=2354 /DNA_ORIENTATION=+ /assembly_acc=CAM_ASM_000159